LTMKRIKEFFDFILKRKRETTKTPDFSLRSVIITPSTQIDLYEDIARDFFERISELQYERVFLTDISSSWDFSALFDFETVEDVRKHLLQKNESIYGVDVSDIADGNMVRIFERLGIISRLSAQNTIKEEPARSSSPFS
jgi:hypothetical protein